MNFRTAIPGWLATFGLRASPTAGFPEITCHLSDRRAMRRDLCSVVCALAITAMGFAADLGKPIDPEALSREGELITLQVTTAPFVIDRRYKSMEGPSVSLPINLKALRSAGGKLQMETAPMRSGHIAAKAEIPVYNGGTELWWFRGAKIEVLAPDSDRPADPGFMCHFNLDVNQEDRKGLFPTLPGFTKRIMIFTNGMTEFVLPRGYGIPVASEETWSCLFQALNHNLDGEHSFRHRVTLYFNRHLGLNTPLRALTWTAPFVAPPLDGDGEAASKICSCCGTPKMGLDARPDTRGRFQMKDGRTATGHWVVPPGRWSWNNPVREFSSGFDQDRKLVATWSHIHPFAERLVLRAFDKDCDSPRDIFVSTIKNAEKGVGLVQIDRLSTEQGISMPATSNYELEVFYNNTSGVRQDAMAVMGLYMTAPEWRVPSWAMVEQNGGNVFCGIPQDTKPVAAKSSEAKSTTAKTPTVKTALTKVPNAVTAQPKNGLFNRLPRFEGAASSNDRPYRVEMTLPEGVVVFRVEPSWAPKTAASLKPLFEKNLYAGRALPRGIAGFILQVPHITPESLSSESDRKLLYRLPAELTDQIRHQPGVLSIALWEGVPESATSSFSVILGKAAHLDGKYTIFAKVEKWEDAVGIVQAAVAASVEGRPSKILQTRLLPD
jgi:cyclophilin family peptidyl-prolyl cis-trans isomerase